MASQRNMSALIDRKRLQVFTGELSVQASARNIPLAISTSGNSANILRVIEAGSEAQVGLIGLDG